MIHGQRGSKWSGGFGTAWKRYIAQLVLILRTLFLPNRAAFDGLFAAVYNATFRIGSPSEEETGKTASF